MLTDKQTKHRNKEITGPSNPAGLPQLLDEVLDSRDFIYGLAALYHGVMSPLSRYSREVKKKGEGNVAKPSQLKAYEYFYAKTGLGPLNQIYPDLVIGKSSRMVMVPVQAALRSHYRNAQFDIDIPGDGRNSIQFFFEQNATAKKYLYFPTSAFLPRSLCLTEVCLLDILWSNPTVREEIVQLLELNMSTKGAAEDKILNYKGILLQELFSLKGYKDVGLQSDDGPRRKLRTSFFTNGLALTLLAFDTSKQKRGERYSMTIAKLDPREPNEREILRISRAYLYKPSKKFQGELERRKLRRGITEIESNIPSFSRPTLTQYFAYISLSLNQAPSSTGGSFSGSGVGTSSSSGAGTGSSSGVEASSSSGSGTSDDNRETIYRALVDFYNDGWFVRNSWDIRKAQNGWVDYVIKAILKLAGGSNGRRRDANTNAVICIGLGSFKTNRGQVSKHGILMKKLVEKCPRPHCDSILENVPFRSKYCRNCKAYFDRDAVGAENIARVCESQIREQKRPAKYMPPDGGTQGQASSGSGGGGGSGGSGGGSSRSTKRKFSDEGGGGVEGSRPPKGPLLGPGGLDMAISIRNVLPSFSRWKNLERE
ncbi:hypothetical protein BCR41DRAFT_426554 [Lobosporangium transversale]|uniref:Uncharacterized protein n=1 Tax=Lobosporangium transversale TaxID=64571 RepID=A0A1Y2G8D4_9FUNG|nr:hypothetical protein BCR41DRAFT_426554 [Lobosporangium transversale]ORY98372.1 hypothetical protein BCR41DRAFT_426554 [Lobosporangium transversale]|eukprot:XP_021875764.1 hypothetical protein BCR41DRAFT_426554 [Lobosporangium transversale]